MKTGKVLGKSKERYSFVRKKGQGDNMASNPQFKVNQLAKDLNVKSKDLTDILAAKGIAVKTQTTLEPAQFDVLFELLTRANQINGIEAYMNGETYIPVKEPQKETVQEKKAEPEKTVTAPAAPASLCISTTRTS